MGIEDIKMNRLYFWFFILTLSSIVLSILTIRSEAKILINIFVVYHVFTPLLIYYLNKKFLKKEYNVRWFFASYIMIILSFLIIILPRMIGL